MRITAALTQQVANALHSLQQVWPTADANNIVTIISRPMWDAVMAEQQAAGNFYPSPNSTQEMTFNGSRIAVKNARGHWAFSHAFPFLLASGETLKSMP